MKKARILFPGFFLILILSACNLPEQDIEPQSPDAVFTHSAQTVAAQLTLAATQASPTDTPVPATPTVTPTRTQSPSATDEPVPCNLAGFVTDVTIPDNTVLTPGQTFLKTWRLRNIGTCTWTSGYRVVYDRGDNLGISSGYSQQLTTGTIPSGQTVDISVNMTAPSAIGTYRSDWSLRDPNGIAFGTNFVVIIKVAGTPTTVTLTPVAGEGGAVRADTTIFMDDYTVGDSATDSAIQTFLSYNISAIPTNATITAARLDLTTNGIVAFGNPFSLGCLSLYPQEYVALDATDFFTGTPSIPYLVWCTATELSAPQADTDLKTLIQSRLGTARIQLRLQYQTSTNSNTLADANDFTAPKLVVSYTAP
jgi:hypothetical protein